MKVAKLEENLAIAKQSERMGIASLAIALENYLQEELGRVSSSKPNVWKRINP